MTADGPNTAWPEPVISFLKDNLPDGFEEEGWADMASSAFQMGCLSLVALGQATRTERGAAPIANPALPDPLPRWDDICVAVIWLAGQREKLSFRCLDGSVYKPLRAPGSFTVERIGAPPPPPPNIGGRDGMGSALAANDVLPVLSALGLVKGAEWAEEAETILWRAQPQQWDLDFASDTRLLMAVDHAVVSLPDDVREQIEPLTIVTDEDIAESISFHEAVVEATRARFGTRTREYKPESAEQIVSHIARQRRDQLDWIFFRRWRFPDGWLTEKEAKRAVEIFHDRLAIRVRMAVLANLHPDRPEFSK